MLNEEIFTPEELEEIFEALAEEYEERLNLEGGWDDLEWGY